MINFWPVCIGVVLTPQLPTTQPSMSLEWKQARRRQQHKLLHRKTEATTTVPVFEEHKLSYTRAVKAVKALQSVLRLLSFMASQNGLLGDPK